MTRFNFLRKASAVVLTGLIASCSGPNDSGSIASARERMAKRDFASAVIELKTAIQKNPNAAEARYLLGVALLEQGDAAAAAVELGKADEAGYDTELLLPKLARAWVGVGRTKELIQKFGRTTLNQPRAHAELRTALAVAHGKLGQGAEAESAVDDALRADPKYPWALTTKARILAASGKFDQALTVASESAAANEPDGEAQLLLGWILRAVKRDEAGARKAFERAAAHPQVAIQARTALIMMALAKERFDDAKAQFSELRKAHPKHPHTHFVNALIAYSEKDFARTETIVDQLLRIAPENTQLLTLGGAASMQRGALIAAETKLGKVVQTVEGSPVARKLLAETYVRMGQPDKALSALRPVLESPRGDGDALALAGQAHLQAGRPLEAEGHFAAAAKLKPDDIQVRTALALTDLARGKPDAAFEALARIAEKDPGETADMALVSVHLRRGEYDAALQAIGNLDKKSPTKAVPKHMRGLALRGKRDDVGARQAFEDALRLDPAHFASSAALAVMDVNQKRFDAARSRMEAVVKAFPGNAAARMALLDVQRAEGASSTVLLATIDNAIKANPNDPSAHVAKIEQLLRSGEVKSAVGAAQVAMAAVPDSRDVLDAAGRAFADAGDNQQAIAAFNKLASVTPKSVVPHLRIADVHTKRGDKGATVSSLRRAYDVGPDSIEVHRRLIKYSLDSRDFAAAMTVAKDLQKRRPQSAAGFLFEGDIEAARKGWPAAVAAYRAAMNKADAGGRPQVRTHGTLVAQGDLAGADRFAAQWLKTSPGDIRFREYLGSQSLHRGDLVDAERRFREVLDVQPGHAVALNNVAWIMADRGVAGSVEMAERAVKASRGLPQVLDTLAKALAAEGRLAEAVETQIKVVAALPDRHDFRLTLAALYAKAGQRQKALAELDTLAKLGDKFSRQREVAAVRRTLEP